MAQITVNSDGVRTERPMLSVSKGTVLSNADTRELLGSIVLQSAQQHQTLLNRVSGLEETVLHSRVHGLLAEQHREVMQRLSLLGSQIQELPDADTERRHQQILEAIRTSGALYKMTAACRRLWSRIRNWGKK